MSCGERISMTKKKIYEKPMLIYLNNKSRGYGDSDCDPGSNADFRCYETGTSAFDICSPTGVSAGSDCFHGQEIGW